MNSSDGVITYSRGERSTRDTADQLRLLIASVTDYAILTLDVRGHIASWNLGAERIKGYRASEILGQHFSRFYPPEDVAWGKPEWELESAIRLGRFEDEGWRLRKDGTRFWANVVITALFDETGELRGFGKVTRDFTQRKHAEETRELERLREALHARDEFLSVASHELKTPLTPLQLKLSSLRRAAEKQPESLLDDGKLARELAAASSQVRKLADLIDDLLDVSRINVGRLPLQPERMDLAALLRDVALRYAPQAASVGCKLDVAASHAVEGTWDRRRMEQAVTNLLTNAIKYGAGKPIHLHVSTSDTVAVLTVRDEGIGIAPTHQRRIFERFVRAVSDPHYGGMGLGLFITHQIVEAHLGSIDVESELGKGSAFTLRIPREGLVATCGPTAVPRV
ncbi:PAS domain S-box protein [Myxococcus landrumensis]|uniref:histidine kinase n=1 Tax=Myxococcus landrumensis TaxID=2813577 RepID=A0ABX7NIW5_9BACT|nr:PAS domain S-box protein [Myxococcus landrumus]